MDAEEAFGKILNGVAVVTAGAKGRRNGMTAAWFTRVSHKPPLVMAAVGKSRFTHGLIEDAGCFCLNVLAEDQLELAKRFGYGSGRKADKLAGLPVSKAETGSPVLEGVAAYMDCRLAGMFPAGDHTLFVGEVVASGSSGRRPLPCRAEDYR